MASNMNELYLRANLAMKEQPVPPQPQVALESLLRIAHSMQETPFQWTFVDKPRGGLVTTADGPCDGAMSC